MSLSSLLGRLSKKREPEYNSGVPIEGATQAPAPLTIEQMIQRYIRTEVSSNAVAEGDESFEDADDFEPDDDEDVLPLTHHQVVAMTDQELRGVAAQYGVDLVDPAPPPAPPAPRGSSGAPEAPPAGTSPPTG